MAERSAGGWVRSDLRSLANTRPSTFASGTCSADNATACASTCWSASSTEINAATFVLPLCAIMPGPAAALLDQPDAFDAHGAIDGFHHVIDGEAGDRYRRQRLHLDAGLPRDLDTRRDFDARQLGVRRGVDLDLGNRERVTQRDQFMGALGGHDAGNAGDAEHIALFRVAFADDVERLWLHDHTALGHRDAFGRGLARYVDHAGFA